MSAAKKKTAPPKSAWTERGVFWLFGNGRPLLMLLILFGALFGGWHFAWQHVKRGVLTSPECYVQINQIEISPLPEWIHDTDVRGNVFHDLTRDGPLNIMDDNLVDRVANAFTRHPCVLKVQTVTKHNPPPQVKVQLTYRQPVCAVEVQGRPLPLPVDAESVLLPSGDFSPFELLRYPRLVGIVREPAGLTLGRRWTDPYVIEGAEIAAVLAPVWVELKLHHLAPQVTVAANGTNNNPPATVGPNAAKPQGDANVITQPTSPAAARQGGAAVFFLFTAKGTAIYWGYSPMVPAGELSAPEKIARLRYYISINDSFDDPRGLKQLDVRTMKPPVQP